MKSPFRSFNVLPLGDKGWLRVPLRRTQWPEHLTVGADDLAEGMILGPFEIEGNLLSYVLPPTETFRKIA